MYPSSNCATILRLPPPKTKFNPKVENVIHHLCEFRWGKFTSALFSEKKKTNKISTKMFSCFVGILHCCAETIHSKSKQYHVHPNKTDNTVLFNMRNSNKFCESLKFGFCCACYRQAAANTYFKLHYIRSGDVGWCLSSWLDFRPVPNQQYGLTRKYFMLILLYHTHKCYCHKLVVGN